MSGKQRTQSTCALSWLSSVLIQPNMPIMPSSMEKRLGGLAMRKYFWPISVRICRHGTGGHHIHNRRATVA